VGINLGRNVWQSDHPVAVAKGLRAIVHRDASVDEATDIFQGAKGDE
jgi:putative autoinducer-2 (AI-2) aldolase